MMAPAGSNSNVAAEARAFAIKAHGDRKYGSKPYVVHLDDVARTAVELGFTSPEHQVVAFLHDVLKDAATQPEDMHVLEQEQKMQPSAWARGKLDMKTVDLLINTVMTVIENLRDLARLRASARARCGSHP